MNLHTIITDHSRVGVPVLELDYLRERWQNCCNIARLSAGISGINIGNVALMALLASNTQLQQALLTIDQAEMLVRLCDAAQAKLKELTRPGGKQQSLTNVFTNQCV